MQAPNSTTFFDLLVENAKRYPEALAAVDAYESITYTELATRARCVASRLRHEGIGRGDVVGLLLDNRITWLEVFFGVTALGAILAPFSTWSTRRELAHLVADAGVSVVFCVKSLSGRDYLADLTGICSERESDSDVQIIAIDGSEHSTQCDFRTWRGQTAAEDELLDLQAEPTDVAVKLYTSGSSALPKCVPLLHGDAIQNGFSIGERQGLKPMDPVLVSVPLFWSYGVINALPAIMSHQGTLILQSRFEPAEALTLIERHQCVSLYTLPAMTNALLSDPSFSPIRTQTLRTGVTIGSPEDVRRVATELGAEDICNIYGSTETYGNCCVTPHDWPLEKRLVSQGPPLENVSLRIRNPDDGELCTAGAVGEIEVSGYITPGYIGESAMHNASVFTDDGWFRTGDLGALNEDGTLVYSGRISEMIKRSGINVSPAEVEDALQQHASVALAGVTGAPDKTRGERIVAFAIAKPGHTIHPKALREHCRELLSSYKLPDVIIETTDLPLTPTGKLMRKALKELAVEATTYQID